MNYTYQLLRHFDDCQQIDAKIKDPSVGQLVEQLRSCMKQIFNPAVNLMNRVSYNIKFTVVTLLFLLPLVVLGFGYFSETFARVDKAKQELSGLKYIKEIERLFELNHDFALQRLASQRNLSAQQLAKTNKAKELLIEKINQLNNDQYLVSQDTRWHQELNNYLESIEKAYTTNYPEQVGALVRYDSFKRLEQHLLSLFQIISNDAGISNDPELSTLYLAKYVTNDNYQTLSILNRIQAIVYFGLAVAVPEPTLYDDISVEFDTLSSKLALLETEHNALLDYSIEIEALRPVFEQQRGDIDAVLNFIDENVFLTDQVMLSQEQFSQELEQRKATFTTAQQTGLEILEKLLNQRVDSESSKLNSLIIVVIISVLIAGYLFIGMSISISESVRYLSKVAGKFIKGDTNARVELITKDEMRELAKTFNWLIESVSSLLNNFESSANNVASQANDVDSLAIKTGKAVEEQKLAANNMSQLAGELIQLVNDANLHTKGVDDSVQQAKGVTDSSGETMLNTQQLVHKLSDDLKQSVASVHSLSEQSNNIAQVLEVIKSIAEQTNLLALNAAIEAARAGEQGRGFAVVADEVRTLAQRTQESTQEIEQTIESLQQGVSNAVKSMETSSDLSKEAASQAEELISASATLKSVMEDIAHNNQDNKRTIEQQQQMADKMSSVLSTMTHLSSQTETMANQSIDAGKEMNNTADAMKKLIDDFYK
ncbi:MAG: methyl-accepting chemotaxis protein [Kangiellaceae bacterium]|jgi:methyl-accepting chemotaxis protein|nr:methyl-accepting chemotaxis protein [Kangiellaceae bacterium]